MDNQKQAILPDENCFNDCDMINDILGCLKTLSTAYHTFVMEAGSQQLQNTVKELMNETIVNQRSVFDSMYSKGWYPVTPETPEKIQQALNKNANLLPQLKK